MKINDDVKMQYFPIESLISLSKNILTFNIVF